MAAPAGIARAARAVFRVCLRVRRGSSSTYADQMVATFDTLLDRATAAGTLAVIGLVAREAVGLWFDGRPTEADRQWAHGSVTTITQDLRFAVRTYRRRPALTAALVLTLALGIGANAAIFSLTKAVLLERLPFPDPSHVVMIWEDSSSIGFPRNTPAPGSYADWLTLPSFEGVAALTMADFNLTGNGDPEKIGGALATSSFFTVLGVPPMLGRIWRPDEDVPGNRLAVLNYSVWVRRFGSDRSVVGRTVDFNGLPYTVIGVMPEHFEVIGPDLEIWAPYGLSASTLADRGSHYLNVVARLKPRVSLAEANAELTALADRRRQDFPSTNRRVGMYARPMLDDYVGDTRPALVVLLLAVGCVLLIACVNVANLLMTQAAGRAKEMAVRTALGANRRRLVRQLLTESVLLSLMGGLLGLGLAWPSLTLLQRLVPPAMRTMSHVALDPLVLASTGFLAAATGVLFGVAPAWRASRVETTRHFGRGVIGSGMKLRTTLVIGEVALAMLLLVGAGLLVQSFRAARAVSLGFRADHILTVRTQLPRRAYAAPAARTQFVETVLARIRSLPGVVSVGYTSAVPLVWKGGTSGFIAEGQARDSSLAYEAANRVVSPSYMTAMAIALRKGRFFDDHDRADTALVGIINSTMARQYWPGVDPLGHRFRFDASDSPWRTIVGIVDDTCVMGIEAPAKAEMYFPVAQAGDNWMWPRDIVVRTEGDPLGLVRPVSAAIWSVDSNQPVSNIRSMQAIVDDELLTRRLQTTLFGVFATLALVLAAVGVYGALSHSVTERTSEIGLRLALGGDPRDIQRRFVLRGLAIAGTGLSLGVIAAVFGATLLDRLLFHVGAHDVRTFVVQAGLLTLVCGLAAYLPARRASRVDPIQTLRAE
jgi:putative ABC transport system permease protein